MKNRNTMIENAAAVLCTGQSRGKMKRLRIDTPQVKAVGSALESLDVLFESPGGRGSAAAHVVVPSHKLAICIPASRTSYSDLRRILKSWESEGWLAAFYLPYQVERLLERGELQRDLKDALAARKADLKKK